MGQVTIRTGLTSRGLGFLTPWNDSSKKYSVLQLHLGYNPMSNLEVVSTINLFNIADVMYQYYSFDRTTKYNPKVYMGAIQTVSYEWNYDNQNGQNWVEKSGSWLFIG